MRSQLGGSFYDDSFAHDSFARFFNLANARPARRPSLVAVESSCVVGAACLECDEPAAEAGELIGWQLGDNFGDFFDFHVAQYSTAGAWLSADALIFAPRCPLYPQKRTSELGLVTFWRRQLRQLGDICRDPAEQ